MFSRTIYFFILNIKYRTYSIQVIHKYTSEHSIQVIHKYFPFFLLLFFKSLRNIFNRVF